MAKPKRPNRITRWDNALPETGLVLVTGDIGEGKSALAWERAEAWHDMGRPVLAYDFTEGARKALPRWVHHVSNVGELQKWKPRRHERGPALLVEDEAALKANGRRAMSSDNIEQVKLQAVARHKGFLVLLIAQSNRQPDVGLVMMAQTVLMKRPTELHVRFTRPELRQEVQEAFEWFAGMSDAESKRHVYAVDYKHGRRGKLTNGLPSFWSERISKAFADVDLQAAEAEAKQRKAMAGAHANGRAA